MKISRKHLAILLIFTLFGIPLLHFKVHAAGVSVEVTSPSNGEFAATTATDVTFRYDPSSSEFANGNTVTVVTGDAGSALTDCTSATTDADGDSTPDGSFGSFSSTGATYTFSAATTQATTNFATFCLKFPDTTTTGIYSISINDTNDYDYGSTLVYVGDDNDIAVTASVIAILSFALRNSSDTSDTNACALGTLNLTSVSTCAYRLKPATNAASGYTVQINSDGDLRRSGSGNVADSEDLDPIPEGNTVASGSEGYGLAFNGGACTGGSITEQGDFNDDDTPFPMTSTDLYSCDGPNSPAGTDTTNTALVTHRAAMDAGTLTGNYTQTVTYYVSASF
jgi:hypothetical protein